MGFALFFPVKHHYCHLLGYEFPGETKLEEVWELVDRVVEALAVQDEELHGHHQPVEGVCVPQHTQLLEQGVT